MNKNTIVALTVVILLSLIAVAYMVFHRTKPTTTPPTLSSKNANTESFVQKTSLKSLMGAGTNQICTFKDTQTGSGGSVHFQNGKMRGDFTSQSQTQTITSHMIMDGEYAYMWMNEEATGFKVSLAAMEEMKTKMAPQNARTIDINQEADYDCAPGSADASLFVIPADKTFTDYSSMMKDAGTMMPKQEAGASAMPDKKAACAACAGLPTDAQAQCKAALGCN